MSRICEGDDVDTFEEHENAYSGLLDDDAETHHWAFGTGFDDPLAGVDTTIPEGVDGAQLASTCLALADDGLVHAQRLAEWLTHGPEVEEEIALANIGLDLIGQARLLYTRAAAADPALLDGLPTTPVAPEDALAHFRDADGFRNVCLAELPRGDFAFTMARLFALSAWRLARFRTLTAHPDPVLAAIAMRGAKELDYHRDHAARWLVTLGRGTDESRRRTEQALADVAPWLSELDGLPGEDWSVVLEHAGLSLPQPEPSAYDGRTGRHTEHLAPLLATLQEVARAHPEGTW